MSTSGRWFIWKNTLAAIYERPISGHGWGSFSAAYGNRQASFFQQQGMHNKEALLADTVYFAFNEWLHLAVELGVPVALLLCVLHFMLLIKAYSFSKEHKENKYFRGCVMTFTGFIAASFISYPFYYLPTAIIYVTVLAGLLYGFASKYLHRYKLFVPVLFGLLICITVLPTSIARLHWHNGNWLMKTAAHRQAVNNLLKGYPNLEQNGAYLLALATAYDHLYMIDSALKYSQQALRYSHDPALHGLHARLLFENRDTLQAEKHFLAAVYTVPNRFRSREQLIKFYVQTKQLTAARNWAEATLGMPVKVRSYESMYIRRRIQDLYTQGIL